MCNTTCNNPSYIDGMDNIPENANIVYVLNDECECCKCNKSICEEPKKVSCRSLACQQLNDECSCKKRKKTRKTTMVNVLENNVIRLEDKMNSGCSEMHQNIEEIINTINNVYNELKDEEARAKLQEAFLHYGLDDAITRVEYNPEDRRMHFYHKNPANCLNVNVHEGCDCDCCNACGCECSCNTDECQSDIPYTMDENCNIVPMSRDEEELFSIDCRDFIRDLFVNSARLEEHNPNAVDGKDGDGPWLVISFKRKFESDLANDDEDATPVEELWINLSKIWKLENYYDKPSTRAQIKLVRIDNTNTVVKPAVKTTIANLVYYDEVLREDVNLGNIDIKTADVINTDDKADFGETTTITTIGDKNINITLPELTLNDATLKYNEAVKYGRIDGTDVKITLPDDPLKRITNLTNTFSFGGSTNIASYTLDDGTVKYITVNAPANPAAGLQEQITNLGDDITNINNAINNIDTDVPVENIDVVVPLGGNTATAFAKVKGQDIKIKVAAPEQAPVDITVVDKNATLTPGSNDLVLATIDGKDITVDVPQATSVSVTANNPTLQWGNESTIGSVDGTALKVTMPTMPEIPEGGLTYAITNVQGNNNNVNSTELTVTPSAGNPWTISLAQAEGADGNDYVDRGTVNENNQLVLTRTDGGTVTVDLPKYITNITQEGNTVTFTWSDNSTTQINVGGDCLWKENGDGLIPVNESKKVYGAGFYDTTVS